MQCSSHSLLRPDLIATAYGYGLDESAFTRFAPLFTVPFYGGTGQPYQQAEAETRKLGAVLGREREAEDVIARTNATISRVKATLASRQKQPIAVVSMFDDRHVRVYGKGGLFQDIFDRIGLENAWTAKTSDWGFSTVGIDALAAIGDARLVSLDPFPHTSAFELTRVRFGRTSPVSKQATSPRFQPSGRSVDLRPRLASPAFWKPH
ncbi:ABC transporter substrate-binding protein [Sinorhizobium fredii]|uniref:ABC transporter substrate-binding protein n=1 Tax=Rhizobium fredii TaxID=380 RepID=UPI0006937382|nr:ABC transporter substrate-binding protein [Sinorhizobium fredii]WOS61459.1 ABC transporter substrate-binding protein [Sinorhizobium fredii GR64]